MAQFGFNPQEVEPQADFAALPAGEYLVMLTNSELKDTKAGTGTYLSLTNQVLDGAYKGRIIFDRTNVTASNPIAQEIGRRAISAICHAVGKPTANESSELHNIPYIVRVVVGTDPKYGDSNEVKGYKSAAGAKPSTTSRPAATPRPTVAPARPAAPADTSEHQPIPQPAAAASAKPAWMR